MDHADPSLAGSPEPLHDSLAGTDAGPGENYAMNAHPTSTEMSWGRGTAPLPQTPSPKTKLGRLHKILDTPLCLKQTRPSSIPTVDLSPSIEARKIQNHAKAMGLLSFKPFLNPFSAPPSIASAVPSEWV